MEDILIMGATCPTSEDMGEVALVLDNALPDDGGVALVVDI